MENKCPICGKPPLMQCKCPMSHSKCADGHEWHRCPVHGTFIEGPIDHSSTSGGFECCCAKKEYDGVRAVV